jgi:hypothetical protein
MCGAASRIGTAGWNMTLSQTRVGRVAGYLMERGIDGGQMQTEAIGNTQTAKHKLDEDRDRSVLLRVVPKIHFKPVHKPDLPRHFPPKPKVSMNFKIAMLLEVDGTTSFAAREFAKKMFKGKVGGGIAFASALFTIWDTQNNLKCTYVYAGIGLGVGLTLPKTGGRSATLHGDWTPFTTEKADLMFAVRQYNALYYRQHREYQQELGPYRNAAGGPRRLHRDRNRYDDRRRNGNLPRAP